MEKLHPRLLAELKKWNETADETQIFSLLATDLSVDDASEKVRSLAVFEYGRFSVYRDGVRIIDEAMSEISAFSVQVGVGCVFASYTRKSDGEEILFARGDARMQSAMGQSVKRANHFLRFGDTDFSRIGNAGGRVCTKCGKPFPNGSSTCPRCSSKKKVLLRLLSLARPEVRFLLVASLCFLATTAIGVVLPYINRVLVDDYIQAEQGNVLLWGFVGVILTMLAVNLLRRLVTVVRGYFLTVAGNRLIVRLRDMVFEKVQSLSVSQISKRTAGELMKRVNGDTNEIKNFLINQLPNVIEQGLLLLAVSLVMLFYDWRLGLLIILPAPVVALGFRLFWRFMRGMFHRRWELNSRANAILHDIFSGIRVVKAFGMEKREEDRYLDISARERDAQIRQERLWAVLMPTLQFFMGIGEFLLLYYVGRQMLAGEMTAGEMSQFSAYASMLFGPLNVLMIFPRHFMQMLTSATRVYEIVDEPLELTDKDRALPPEVQGYIDIEHISFGYEDTDEVLHDIDLHIRPGEFVGLVGKSGVGKSTLINLIMRMYDVNEGAIRIDGMDLRDISRASLSRYMGVVLQENFLFSGSVWQNLTYAKPDATREEVVAAAKAAGAHEFIVRLPDGYNTYIGEKGHTLSGGERQRISIARALLHDPKILILDEATSALDTETEKLIQDALLELSHGRTTIAIAHRLSTLRNANRLVVLDKGCVAEIGSHEELMEKQGIYYGLVMAQRDMSNMED